MLPDHVNSCYINGYVGRLGEVTTSKWPSFLYDQELYDLKDEEVGLLKGYLLLHVCRLFCLLIMVYIPAIGIPTHIL